MKCNEVLELLAPLADGELDETAAKSVEQHAVACTSCGGELAEIRRLGMLLRTSVASQVDEIDLSRLWPAVRRGLPASRPSRWQAVQAWWQETAWRVGVPAMAAAALAMVAYMIALNAQPSASPEAARFAAVDFSHSLDLPNTVEQLQSPYDSVSVFHDPNTRSTLVWVGDTGPASEAFE